MALFEAYERRIDQINAVLNSYGISSIEEAEKITKDAGLDVYDQVKKIQPICFENACWAYTVGAAIAIKKGCKKAADAAAAIGIGLQAFGQRDPVVEYRLQGYDMFNDMTESIREETVKMLMHVRIEQKVEREQVAEVTGTNKDDSANAPIVRKSEKISRNAPCPCGSGKKYKYCCGR